jgi:hypothetical protein
MKCRITFVTVELRKGDSLFMINSHMVSQMPQRIKSMFTVGAAVGHMIKGLMKV